MSKAIVFGLTGYAGTAITHELLSRGFDVVGVARDTSTLTPAEHLEIATGSLHDGAFVTRVLEGAAVAVIALPARSIDGKKLIDALPGLLTAAATSGTRLGIVGGAGSLLVEAGGPRVFDTPDFPREFKDEATSHAAILDSLKVAQGAADWFYVSPAAEFGSYKPGQATGRYRVGGDILLRDADGHSNISGPDYATAFVDEIDTPAHHQTRFTVAY